MENFWFQLMGPDSQKIDQAFRLRISSSAMIEDLKEFIAEVRPDLIDFHGSLKIYEGEVCDEKLLAPGFKVAELKEFGLTSEKPLVVILPPKRLKIASEGHLAFVNFGANVVMWVRMFCNNIFHFTTTAVAE